MLTPWTNICPTTCLDTSKSLEQTTPYQWNFTGEGIVDRPNPPWSFGNLSVSLVHQGKEHHHSQNCLNSLQQKVIGVRMCKVNGIKVQNLPAL